MRILPWGRPEGRRSSKVRRRVESSGLGGETVVRVDPEDGVGFEVALTPVHVLQVLGGDDRDVEVERLRWRTRGCHWRRG
ncbi:unnamed protein product [Camellia sinensis]